MVCCYKLSFTMFGKFRILFASEIPEQIRKMYLAEFRANSCMQDLKIAKIYCLWAKGPETSKFTCIFQVLGSLSISMQLSFFANTNPCNGNKIVIINNCWVHGSIHVYPASESLLPIFCSGKHFRRAVCTINY